MRFFGKLFEMPHAYIPRGGTRSALFDRLTTKTKRTLIVLIVLSAMFVTGEAAFDSFDEKRQL